MLVLNMYVCWIVLGIISFSGVPLCEAQISQLSNSPYGGSSFLDNFRAAQKRIQQRATPAPRRPRVRQNVVNPRSFGMFANTNKPFGSAGDFRANRPVTPRPVSRSRWSNVHSKPNGGRQQPFEVSKAETFMYRTEPAAPTTVAYGRLLQGVSRDNMNKVTALYALDRHSEQHTSQVPSHLSTKNVRHVSRSRFKVLPDGSIVDYGTSTSDRNRVVPITRPIRPKPTTVVPPRSPVLTSIMKSSPRMVKTTTFQIQPTVSSQPRQAFQPETVRNFPSKAVRPNVRQIKPAVTSIDKLKPSSVWLNPRGVSGIAVRLSDLRHQTSMKPRVLLGPIDDGVRKPVSGVVDDPMGQFERKTEPRTRPFTPTRTRTKSMTTPIKTTTTATTTTTTTTTTPPPPTTKTTTPTTTTTTTTIVPPTTTQKPKRSPWNGPDGLNITFGDDKHVCPSSRARWQDYTVYLETKPRLCMIQITWNARYKREPRYHNSWWGVDVEWVYKPVYDPKVEFIDMHSRH